MKRTMLRLLIVASGVVCMAWGQDPPDQEEGPGRGVARISLMNGDVSVRRGDSGEVVAAALNAPLVVEDQILTGPDSRAEVQFDCANMVRLAPMSEVRFADAGEPALPAPGGPRPGDIPGAARQQRAS